jgi:hypothetical protein
MATHGTDDHRQNERMFATAKKFLQKVLAPGQLGTAQTFVLAVLAVPVPEHHFPSS